jgi:MinD superfamily P-loop ATPase
MLGVAPRTSELIREPWRRGSGIVLRELSCESCPQCGLICFRRNILAGL